MLAWLHLKQDSHVRIKRLLAMLRCKVLACGKRQPIDMRRFQLFPSWRASIGIGRHVTNRFKSLLAHLRLELHAHVAAGPAARRVQHVQ